MKAQARAQSMADNEASERKSRMERVEDLHAHYKASEVLQGFVHKALRSWPGMKKGAPCEAPLIPSIVA